MNTRADKIQDNTSRAVAHQLSSKPGNDQPVFQPEEARPGELHEMAGENQHVKQLRTYQAMADKSLGVKQLRTERSVPVMRSSQPVQRNESREEEVLQEKPSPVQKKENTTGMPDRLKSGIENFSGFSMDDVKVHFNSDKPAQFQAHAYAQGTDIHLASGQEKHLPHEAWHVVQQKQGRVQPTIQRKGGVEINDDEGLEAEADKMGEKAAISNAIAWQKQSTAPVSTDIRPLVQRLKKKSDDSVIDIGSLSLVRTYDILNRPDPDPDADGFIFEAGDRAALRAHADTLLPGAFTAIRNEQIGATDLAVLAARNSQVSGNDQQILLDFMRAMEHSGHVIGFSDWIAYTAHLEAEQKQDHFNELWETARQLLFEGRDNIDLRETAIPNSGQTADLTTADAQIEVKTIRNPLRRSSDINNQLTAGLLKFNGAAVGKSYEVTLFASIEAGFIGPGHTERRKNINTNVSADAGTLVFTTTRSRVDTGDVVATSSDNLLNYLKDRLENGHIPGAVEACKVTVIMENANSFVAVKQADGVTWNVSLL